MLFFSPIHFEFVSFGRSFSYHSGEFEVFFTWEHTSWTHCAASLLDKMNISRIPDVFGSAYWHWFGVRIFTLTQNKCIVRKIIESKNQMPYFLLPFHCISFVLPFGRPVDFNSTMCKTGAHHMSSPNCAYIEWPIEWQPVESSTRRMDFERNETSNARKCKNLIKIRAGIWFFRIHPLLHSESMQFVNSIEKS